MNTKTDHVPMRGNSQNAEQEKRENLRRKLLEMIQRTEQLRRARPK